MLGLRFCARALSSCGKWGPLFIAVRGSLTIVASLVAEHRLQTRRLSSCGSRAQLLHGMWDLPRPGLEPVSPALAGRFSATAPPGKPRTIFLYRFDCTCYDAQEGRQKPQTLTTHPRHARSVPCTSHRFSHVNHTVLEHKLSISFFTEKVTLSEVSDRVCGHWRPVGKPQPELAAGVPKAHAFSTLADCSWRWEVLPPQEGSSED